MAVTYNYLADAQYTYLTPWYGTLQIVLTDQSWNGAGLEAPIKFAFDMPEEVIPSTNTNYDVDDSGVATTHVSGTLPQALPGSGRLIFNVNISSPTGTLTADDLPTVYYVNDATIIGHPPVGPDRIWVPETSDTTATFMWHPGTAGDYPVKEYLITLAYTAPDGNRVYREISASQAPLTVTDLPPDTLITVFIQAVDEQGGVSPANAFQTFRTDPAK
ncbi:fibronectin type III domain-containing protein [Vagococcus sp. WN89Y]|uniref:fibronectin type III domain-containing protein n=1 Tax=Vagococcus sp. WN89Y TaxID=3457258 RepID=UPI003FCCD4B1